MRVCSLIFVRSLVWRTELQDQSRKWRKKEFPFKCYKRMETSLSWIFPAAFKPNPLWKREKKALGKEFRDRILD